MGPDQPGQSSVTLSLGLEGSESCWSSAGDRSELQGREQRLRWSSWPRWFSPKAPRQLVGMETQAGASPRAWEQRSREPRHRGQVCVPSTRQGGALWAHQPLPTPALAHPWRKAPALKSQQQRRLQAPLGSSRREQAASTRTNLDLILFLPSRQGEGFASAPSCHFQLPADSSAPTSCKCWWLFARARSRSLRLSGSPWLCFEAGGS